jgi:uncharacterized protein (DUF305 family)
MSSISTKGILVMKRLSFAPAVIAALVAVAVTGCGSDDGGSPAATTSQSTSMPGMDHGSTTSPAADHNAADVTFATAMIPHHAQAVVMADLALKKSTHARLRQLATAIKGAQSPEIRLMSGWLTGWGEPVPTATMHHGGMPADGMMSDQELAALGKANGQAFDRMWLQGMIAHHQGAVTMAKTEQTAGRYAPAVALAKQIQTAQNREVTTMQGLLSELVGR